MIRYMNYQTKLEMRRLLRSLGPCSYNYFYPLLDDYMASAAMDKPKSLRLWTWDDASKIVNFMTVHQATCEKYGLNMPHFAPRSITKEEIKQKENELYEYFLYEMRKPAKE